MDYSTEITVPILYDEYLFDFWALFSLYFNVNVKHQLDSLSFV